MPWTDSMPWINSIVAIIEPDPSVRLALGRLLRSADYFAVAFPGVEGLLASPLRAYVDCLIFKLEAEGPTAEDLQQRLTAREWAPPVLLLAAGEPAISGSVVRPAARDHRDRVVELATPFDPDELLCRVRILVARSALARTKAGDIASGL